MTKKIINISIIAHVDHGKTTLIDALLKQTGGVKQHQEMEIRAMDSNDLERERGITILAKCTSIKHGDYCINVVDTPGHADFGGEVERILGMVDGAIVLVDAAEGPLPQTKFVLTKALKLNVKPIVVINKVDRKDARAKEVLDEMYELFMMLGANEEQLDFKVLYASGRSGWSSYELDKPTENLTSLLDTVVKEIPLAKSEVDKPMRMLSVILEIDQFLGILLTGKIEEGTLRVNDAVKALDLEGNLVETGRISKILAFDGLRRVPVETASAGDIVIVCGLKKATVTNTICAMEVTEPLKAHPIDPPTISITISVNDSPLSGKDGKKFTSRMIGERLFKEAEKNVALKVEDLKDSFQVSGRGELHLGILIETMRREGIEMSVSRPEVIFQVGENGKKLEPIEEVIVDVDDDFAGAVIEKLSLRKGLLDNMFQNNLGKTRMIFSVPTRGLIGYHSEFLTDTRGTGILNRSFKSYEETKGDIPGRPNGVLIANEAGQATAYALFNLEARGEMFIKPGDEVYEGMIIGEHNKNNDLIVNCVKAKQLTNVRSAGKDDSTKCKPPIVLTIEDAISYIAEDELLEITAKSLRLRKKYLLEGERKRHGK
jgi:GTP-binding protein